jgi:hypothetical protein
MILWECCGTVPIPPASLLYPWVTIFGLASTSTHHSSSVSGPVCFVSWSNAGLLSHQLANICSQVGPSDLAYGQNLWVVLANDDDIEGVVMLMRVLRKSSHTSDKPKIPPVDNIWPRFHLNSSYILRSGPVCVGSLLKNIVLFVSVSSTWWWHRKCCGSIRLLWNWYHTCL